ncbi:hypothetical protein SEMRO_1739_G294590.1 [Seminavis robusta]|uniref:Uncharacterized protein n=1 Tax=Seminavis robusta TaxID=568900 RepID=A0A9N8HV41_9STRA|nr:hypothetical protein SEMRO_1739_G294590.1 [Seminavis robusta]|eukprot:Sro1739_g294590.1 n/a (161) ;mRNA; f:20173-20753
MAGKRKNKKNGHTHRKKGKNRSKDERAVWARQQQQQQQAALQTPHLVTPHVTTGPFHNEDIDGVLPPPAASLRSAARKPTTEQPDDERLNELLGPPSDDEQEPPSDDDDAAAADLRLTPEEMESFLRQYWIGNQGRSWDEDAEANQEYLRRHQLLCQERP